MKQLLLFILILLVAKISMAQTVSSLSDGVTGTNIKWHSLPSGGTLFIGTETLVNNQTYYASQTVNGVESTARLAVKATGITLLAPTAATHTASKTQVVWNWNTVTGATSYKWGTTTVYADATDMGTTITKTETGLTCNISYTRYIWATNGICVPKMTMLTQTTLGCLAIGDAYQGGIIFYLLGPGDLRYDPLVQHGIISALTDQSTGIAWITGGATQYTANGGTVYSAIGYGQANTTAMMSQAGYTGGAAKVCNDYINIENGTGVYDDWYLPTVIELIHVFFSRVAIGGFTDTSYWTSMECNLQGQSASSAWICDFSNNATQSNPGKYSSHPVRAVRSF